MADNADLLFELGTEELPPTALRRLRNALRDEFVAGLENARLSHGAVRAYAAPRRLALWVRDLALNQPDREVERRGPALKAAFDADGKHTRAAEGFAGSCGTTVDQLDQLETIQLKREPYPLPKLKINPDIKTLEDLETWVTLADFELEGYRHHPAIQYAFSV